LPIAVGTVVPHPEDGPRESRRGKELVLPGRILVHGHSHVVSPPGTVILHRGSPQNRGLLRVVDPALNRLTKPERRPASGAVSGHLRHRLSWGTRGIYNFGRRRIDPLAQ